MEAEINAATFEIAKQKEKAVQSEKYKEQFLANMSHEIRTPLNAIMGMIKILKRKDHASHQIRLLDHMDQSASHLSILLNDILDLSKIEAGKIEIDSTSMNVQEIIEQVIFLLGFRAKKKGLDMVLEMDHQLPESVMGDPHRLLQILINLLGNAIKFSENGEIVIRCQKGS